MVEHYTSISCKEDLVDEHQPFSEIKTVSTAVVSM
jgi:hypothetical protein